MPLKKIKLNTFFKVYKIYGINKPRSIIYFFTREPMEYRLSTSPQPALFGKDMNRFKNKGGQRK